MSDKSDEVILPLFDLILQSGVSYEKKMDMLNALEPSVGVEEAHVSSVNFRECPVKPPVPSSRG